MRHFINKVHNMTLDNETIPAIGQKIIFELKNEAGIKSGIYTYARHGEIHDKPVVMYVGNTGTVFKVNIADIKWWADTEYVINDYNIMYEQIMHIRKLLITAEQDAIHFRREIMELFGLLKPSAD